ncbi:MAG: 2Fe-2S iron-sulfur cluster-binding protein, partial [Dehalococcoidia bacterium]|nr:2Fe-2S iron-sulfur cluster-binding protein [Dehalococcoidia bacterium]
MSAMPISFTLNGKEMLIQADPRRRLLDVLREDLSLTGTKEGCGQGNCGGCSVLINGVPTNACLIQVGKVAGQEVITIEGLGTPAQLHTVQQAFIQAG